MNVIRAAGGHAVKAGKIGMKAWSSIVTAAATAAAATAGILLCQVTAHAGEIAVLCPPPMRTVLAELIPQFEASSGHKVVVTYQPSKAIIARIDNGESVDIAVLTDYAVDDLIKAGKLARRVDLARSRIGIAVRTGAPRPDASTAEAFKRTLLAAKSFARNDGADSGIFMAGLLDRLGIAAEMKPKTTLVATGYVAELVARGEVALGAQQVSELMSVPGVDVTPLPDEIQHVIVFSAGIAPAPKDADAVQALIVFLTSPAAAAVIRAKGHDPA
jgi:molybdate transport system substrate-binding protein